MKTIKITLARNKENELYKRKHYWLVLNAPIVVDFNAPDDTLDGLDRNYHLWPGSPCIDTGYNSPARFLK